MKRRDIVYVSEEHLISVLGLPLSSEIIDARMNNFKGGRIEFVITGPSVSECAEGAYPVTKTIDSFDGNHG